LLDSGKRHLSDIFKYLTAGGVFINADQVERAPRSTRVGLDGKDRAGEERDELVQFIEPNTYVSNPPAPPCSPRRRAFSAEVHKIRPCARVQAIKGHWRIGDCRYHRAVR